MSKNNQESPEILNRFLNYIGNTKGKSTNTVNGYKYDLNLFLKYMVNVKHNLKEEDISNIDMAPVDVDFIKSITYDDLEDYMSYLTKIRNNDNNARSRKTASIKSFFNYLELKAKTISYNPARELESPKKKKRDPVFLNDVESSKLLEVALDAVKKDKRNAIRDYCILTIFLDSGMRRAELDSMNLSAIKEDIAKTIGKGDKQNTKYLTEDSLVAIQEYLKVRPTTGIKQGDEDALFLSELKQRMSLKSINNVVAKYVELSGVGTDKKVTCHRLRHTFATRLLKDGVDILTISKLLNHSSVNTTQIYTHLNEDNLRTAVNSSKTKR